ncbi:ATP-binding cassette domain-containing protein [Leifsonia sp. fls2-241-R2A-40a]|uniref:ATP-binding cassette domain-containing protein n=1 Tax=Leifsonia sp. fls2-241-R2A-40a TaxID=3040290 RepID=UPI00254D1EC6|nr:ATP-binding cassette domain-containing protein [Leifsonia sp. fls2-241-R2A-40a]
MRLKLENLGHAFSEGRWLFRGLTGEIVSGSTYAVTGPSGSGKSTLLSLLAGWHQPVEGNITRDECRSVAWVFQNPFGVARRTAQDHVALALLAQGLSPARADAQAAVLLDRFGLRQVRNRAFSALSGGEAQRLMLARAVASDADVLLVDEPTAQLDRSSARIVNETIGQLARRDKIVVIATHDEETRARCRRSIDLGVSGVFA